METFAIEGEGGLTLNDKCLKFVSIFLDYLPDVSITCTRLNTATLRTENFSGDLKTEVVRLQEENNAMAESIMHNRIAIFVLAILVLLNLVFVVWLALR